MTGSNVTIEIEKFSFSGTSQDLLLLVILVFGCLGILMLLRRRNNTRKGLLKGHIKEAGQVRHLP